MAPASSVFRARAVSQSRWRYQEEQLAARRLRTNYAVFLIARLSFSWRDAWIVAATVGRVHHVGFWCVSYSGYYETKHAEDDECKHHKLPTEHPTKHLRRRERNLLGRKTDMHRWEKKGGCVNTECKVLSYCDVAITLTLWIARTKKWVTEGRERIEALQIAALTPVTNLPSF